MRRGSHAHAAPLAGVLTASALALTMVVVAPPAAQAADDVPEVEAGALVGPPDVRVVGKPAVAGGRVFATLPTPSIADGGCPTVYADTETLSVPLDDLSSEWAHGWGASPTLPGVLQVDRTRGDTVVTGTPCITYGTPPQTITTEALQRSAEVVAMGLDGVVAHTAVSDSDGGWAYYLENIADGTRIPWSSLPQQGVVVGFDSTTLWRKVRSYESGPAVDRLSGYDIATGDVREIPLDDLCTYAWVERAVAYGRWLRADCRSADQRSWAIDLQGVYAPIPVSPDAPVLGDGFTVTAQWTAADPEDLRQVFVTVQETTGERRTRSYGPLGNSGFVVSSDSRWLTYTDPDSRARLVDLSWVTRPVADIRSADTMAPHVPHPSTVAVSATTQVSVTWAAATDAAPQGFTPSGVDSYDLEYRRGSGAWTMALPATRATSWSVTAARGEQVCFRLRARDNVGNLSGWSQDSCSRVDDTAPTFTRPPSVAASTLAVDGYASVPTSYKASDDTGVRSYDLRYRLTPKGQPTADWVYTTALQKTTATTASLKVRAGTLCVSARARDAMGNVSAWTSARCGFVDGAAPKVTRAAVSPRAGEWGGYVNFAWAATDDDRIASYDVQYRKASANGALGSWRWAVEGHITTRTSLREPLYVGAGEQICFRVRAYDRVGHASAWTVMRCAYQERLASASLERSAGASVAWDGAHMRKLVRFPVKGARATAKVAIPGRSVSVVARTGPTAGTLHVYSGSTKIGEVRLASSKAAWKRFTVVAPRAFTGKISFRSASSRVSYVRSWTVVR